MMGIAHYALRLRGLQSNLKYYKGEGKNAQSTTKQQQLQHHHQSVIGRKKKKKMKQRVRRRTVRTPPPFPYVCLHQDAKPLVELNITRRSEIGLSADCCTPAPAKEQKKRGRKRGRGKKGGRTRILNKLIERQFFYMLALKETKSKLVR